VRKLYSQAWEDSFTVRTEKWPSNPKENLVTEASSIQQLAQIVIRGLAAGKVMEIEGLGTFYPDRDRGCRFEPPTVPQVFIAYVREDVREAEKLAVSLEAAGFTPWMDSRKLLPGQNWPRAIEAAIESSDFFVACFSENSVNKKGGFQAEIRYALDCARSLPLDAIFIVPVRLNGCRLPESIQREYQYVDLFPDWQRGMRRIVTMIRREVARRKDMLRPITG
jgi:hypothetical protein